MKNLENLFIGPEATVYQAIEGIDKGELQIMLVVDECRRLLGSVSDGDVRRAILADIDLAGPVSRIMNSSPVSVPHGVSRIEIIALMKTWMIHCIPVVNTDNRVIGLETESRLLWQGVEDTWVVLMAGGLGMRLRPLTDKTPKPLLPLNGKPLLEGILDRFVEQGFRRFFIAINYKSEMFMQHFGDGSKWGCEITYLNEDKRLGTAGALSLLPKDGISENLLVMNGDLLTTVDFRQFLDFHKKANSLASMCVRDYSIQVPYGVVEVDGYNFAGVTEKPAHRYYINAGIYLLSSSVIGEVPKNKFLDITDLFEKLKNQNHPLSVFPMREQWLDIGDLKEYQDAQMK